MKPERTLSAASKVAGALLLLGFAVADAQVGGLDGSFAPDINGTVMTAAAQPDGKLVIGGMFTQVNGVARPYLARLNANGTLDASFAPASAPAQFVNHVEVAQGQLFVGGGDGIRQFASNGALGWHYPIYATTFAVDPSQRVVFGGRFTRVDNQFHRNLARLTAQGTLDASFNPEVGCCAQDGVDTVVSMGTQILVGGAFSAVSGHASANLARLDASGAPDQGFVAAAEPRVLDVSAAPEGKVYRASEQVVARHLANGAVDSSFAPQIPAGFDERFLAVATQGDGVLIGGNFTLGGSTPRTHLARLTADGSVDGSFSVQPNGPVRDIVVQADGSVIIVGDFTAVDGQPRAGIARLGREPGAIAPALATLVTPGGLVVSWPAAAANGRLEFKELNGNAWTAVGIPTVTLNGRCCVTNPIVGSGRIYRLVRP
jgi:uncharacterized delta-60 repeat protein